MSYWYGAVRDSVWGPAGGNAAVRSTAARRRQQGRGGSRGRGRRGSVKQLAASYEKKIAKKLTVNDTIVVGSYGGGDAMQMSRIICRYELDPKNIPVQALTACLRSSKYRDKRGAPLDCKGFTWHYSLQFSSRVYATDSSVINLMAHGRIFKGATSFDNLQKYPFFTFVPLYGVNTGAQQRNARDPAVLEPFRFKEADQHVHTVDIDPNTPRYGSDMAKVYLHASDPFSAFLVCAIDMDGKTGELVQLFILDGDLEGKFETGNTQAMKKPGYTLEAHVEQFAETEFKGQPRVAELIKARGKLPPTIVNKYRTGAATEFVNLFAPPGAPPASRQKSALQTKIDQVCEIADVNEDTALEALQKNKFDMQSAINELMSKTEASETTSTPETTSSAMDIDSSSSGPRPSAPPRTPITKRAPRVDSSGGLSAPSGKSSPESAMREPVKSFPATTVACWTVDDFSSERKRLLSNTDIMFGVLLKHNQQQSRKIFEDNGYDSIDAFQDLTLDECKSMGIKLGWAKSIIRKAQRLCDSKSADRSAHSPGHAAGSGSYGHEQIQDLVRASREQALTQGRLEQENKALAKELSVLKPEADRLRMKNAELTKELTKCKSIRDKFRRKNTAFRKEQANLQEQFELQKQQIQQLRNQLRGQQARPREAENGQAPPSPAGPQAPHTPQKRQTVLEYVREQKAKGKTKASIIRGGRRLGFKLQHITVALNEGRNSPGAEREVSRGQRPARAAPEVKRPAPQRPEELKIPTAECVVCGEKHALQEMVACNNARKPHYYCIRDFTASVRVKLGEDKLTCACMEDSCGPFTIVDFYKIQDSDLRGQIDALTFRKAELNDGERMVHCTKAGCKNRVIVTDESAAAAGHVWECDQCMSFYCIKCEPQVKLCDDGRAAYYNRIVSGEGSGHECTEDKKGTIRRLLVDCATKCSLVFCSNCKNGPIYKEGQGRGFEGCNVVRCPRCNKHVCWVCTKILSESSAKAHDQMPHDNDVHGAKGCELFNTEKKYVHGWRREHSFRDFCAAIRSKGYSKALIREVMAVPGIIAQFQNERPTLARIQAFVEGLE